MPYDGKEVRPVFAHHHAAQSHVQLFHIARIYLIVYYCLHVLLARSCHGESVSQ